MEFFNKAKEVRLRSHHDKYLYAVDDEETVAQSRSGSSKNARWTVEPVPWSNSTIILKSCYGYYLTASNQPFLLGMTGCRVLQTAPTGQLGSAVEWEPVREGGRVKLKTKYGNFLRANGGLPPWRNSVTHDIPHRTSTQEWVLWDVDVVDILMAYSPAGQPKPVLPQLPDWSDSRQESSESYARSPPKSEGRKIYYHVADENGKVDYDDDVGEGFLMVFKGNGVEELTRRLKEEMGIDDIVVCTRSPLNGKLYPLRLQLPPNNSDMHVVVQTSSTVARDFSNVGL